MKKIFRSLGMHVCTRQFAAGVVTGLLVLTAYNAITGSSRPHAPSPPPQIALSCPSPGAPSLQAPQGMLRPPLNFGKAEKTDLVQRVRTLSMRYQSSNAIDRGHAALAIIREIEMRQSVIPALKQDVELTDALKTAYAYRDDYYKSAGAPPGTR